LAVWRRLWLSRRFFYTEGTLDRSWMHIETKFGVVQARVTRATPDEAAMVDNVGPFSSSVVHA
jgi:hypothetical protein